MILSVFLISSILVYILAQSKRLVTYGQKIKQIEEDSLRDFINTKKESDIVVSELTSLETKITEFFFFYELTRKVAPILDKTVLVDTFIDDMKFIGEVKRLPVSCEGKSDCLTLYLDEAQNEPIYLKTQSEKVKEYLPYFINLLRLCNERAGLYERLQQLSIYDSLTEVYNRRYFMMRFAEEFSRADKHGLNLSFLMIDIDNFKKINDTYGHLVGDAVLRDIARIISDNMREIDFVSRYGGEEFGVVLLETDKAGAIMVAERIVNRISKERIKAFDENLAVTVSLGLATCPADIRYSDGLIETADKALYKAKMSGKNRVAWF